MIRAAFAVALFLVACSSRAPSRPGGAPSPRRIPTLNDRMVRVALVAPMPRVSATTGFNWLEGDGRTLVARARKGEQWRVEHESGGVRVRAVRPDGVPTVWHRTLVTRPNDNGFITVNDKRYRGEIRVVSHDSSLVVVNRLGIEDYLRGVVPAEMGKRPRGDSAALQAQAVASRSFVYVRLAPQRPFDVRGSTADQAYGGVEVENEEADAAVEGTRALVLRYGARTADAPYSSTCGGTTAEPSEVWRTENVAYLRRVSDRIGDSNRYYCENAPRYRWSRSFNATQLNATLDQYLKSYASVPGGKPGPARVVAVGGRTPSGRVSVLEVETDRGIFNVRGNDIRYVLRAPGGEILHSTYFSVEPEYGRDGRVTRATFRGQGNGHGVGMCQWGAIGRARAGQSFRTILGTYYPGTTIGVPPVQ